MRTPSDLVGRRLARAIPVAALLALPVAARGQANPCTARHPMVDAVSFEGTRRVPAADVASAVETERTSVWRRWFGWKVGTLTCLDSTALVADAAHIDSLYLDRGFIGVRTNARVVRHGERRARVVFEIREGTPITIGVVAIEGLPPSAGDSATVARRLTGLVLDDSVVRAVADSVRGAVRDAGFARARPVAVDVTRDSARRTATVRLRLSPGPRTWIDTVVVRLTPAGPSPALDDAAIRRSMSVREGQSYSARDIAEGQRELLALDLYRQIRVDTLRPRTPGSDSIGLALTLVEGDPRRGRATAGWGTLDCFRAQARITDDNVASLGHRLELAGRVSKVGLESPFTGLKSLCAPEVRDDPFSQHLNYYAGATLRFRGLRVLRDPHLQPAVTVFSERRSAVNAYEQTTDLGVVATTTHELGERFDGTVQYAYTTSHTFADRATACDRFGLCRLEDVTSFLLRSPMHAVTGILQKNPLLPTDDPANGSRWRAELKLGNVDIGGIQRLNFGRLDAEYAAYHALSDWFVAAARLEVGTIITPGGDGYLLPPSERFYGGGQNSVRGYGQNLLGPGSYIVTAIDTVPTAGGAVGVARTSDGGWHVAPSGGNALWVANFEIRTRRGWPTDLLRWVAFVDVGRVWNTRDLFSATNADARATPGVGVRLVTPLGPFRVDVGFNPNALEPGPAFLVTPSDVANGVVGRAVCVSPGSTELLSASTTTAPLCPASFLPSNPRSVLSRLTVHFSLGNAF